MTFDPFEINKQLFVQWEKSLGAFFEKRMRDPEFMQQVGKSMSLSFDSRAALDEKVQQWLQAMNLPTREDMERLFKTINELETRLIDLEDRVAEGAPAPKPAISPARPVPPARPAAAAAAGGPPPPTPRRPAVRSRSRVAGKGKR